MIKPIKETIEVKGIPISIESSNNADDYISLTDMVKGKDGNFFISDWLRNRNTLEFIDVWERLYNPNFNYGEFAIIKGNAGLNNFKISVKELIARTNIICLKAKTGRYGGTFAHKDIAFEFGMWISPEFKLLLIKEYQRLKSDENHTKKIEWNVKREIAKSNYRIHTDAIKENLIPNLTPKQIAYTYANEADLINVALFGQTAKQWKALNPEATGNIRDDASIAQLIVLSNLESLNAEFIREGIPQSERLTKLNRIAIYQLKSLWQNSLKNIEKLKQLK